MKKFFALGLFVFSLSGLAQITYDGLNSNDQKYYKNDSLEGNNNRERTDSLVKEVNKMYGEMNSLRNEVRQLKAEVEELKKKK